MEKAVVGGQWLGVSGQFLELELSSRWKRFLMFQRLKVDLCGFLVKINSNEGGGFGIPLRVFWTRIEVSPPPLPSLESSP